MPIFEWRSALEVTSVERPEPDHIVDQLIVRGTITQLTAKIKVGKTTLLNSLIKGMLHEHDVIGLNTKRAKVLYCTEEGPTSFTRSLRRTGIDAELDLGILHLQDVPHTFTWSQIAQGIKEMVLQHNIDVVIFDTLTRWARMRADKENDAGEAGFIMESLEFLRKTQCAIIAVFHEKKSGGDINDASRGSSAFGGAADILVRLTDVNHNGHPNRRKLQATGRIYEEREWLIEWKDGDYHLIKNLTEDKDSHNEDEADSPTLSVERDIYLSRLPSLLSESEWLTMDEIALDFGIDSKNRTLRSVVNSLIDSGLIESQGAGVRGNPKLYRLKIGVPK